MKNRIAGLLLALLITYAPTRCGIAKYRHTFVNKTDYTLTFSVDYVSAFCGDEKFDLNPRAIKTIEAGACELKGVYVLIRANPPVWVTYKEHFTGDGTWVIERDPNDQTKFRLVLVQAQNLVQIIGSSVTTAAEVVGGGLTTAANVVGGGIDEALQWLGKHSHIMTCPVTNQPIKMPLKDFSILTLNTYCFPRGTASALGTVRDIAGVFSTVKAKDIPNIQSGIRKSVAQRLHEIAQFVIGQAPDVACFQETWGDSNKEDLVDALCGGYPYNYYVPSSIPLYNLVMLDDGLLISSKYPFIFTTAITFQDRTDDENLAHKGALFVGLRDRQGNLLLIVNTHLQSGTAIEAIAIKNKQMHAIGKEISRIVATYPIFTNARICVVGDLNEPIQFKIDRKLLADRTQYLVRALKNEGINLSNDQAIAFVARELGAEEIVTVNELAQQGIIKTTDGAFKQLIRIDDPLVKRVGSYRFDPVAWSSDPDATQILDHVLLDGRSRLIDYKIFRQEILGSTGRVNGSDLPPAALSDHAAVMVTFERI